MAKYEKVYIIDTNVILEDANQLITIAEDGKNLLVLPETVIDELDSKKSGFEEINFQARQFGRILSDAVVTNTKKVGSKRDVTIMSVSIKNVDIDIVSFKDYELNNIDMSVINDRKIIKVASFATKYYKNPDNTILLSNDIMCRTRAISLNVKSEGIANNADTLKNEFLKELYVKDTETLNLMNKKFIEDYDREYNPGNYCYRLKTHTGDERIAYIKNGLVNFIADNMYQGLPVKPINLEQKFATAGMVDTDIDVCIIEALAGSGKTLLALSAGIKMVKIGKYDKIIYIRNSVESVDKAEEIGFLPGGETEKLKGFNYPLYDTLEFIAKREMKKKDNKDDQESVNSKIEELINRYVIETVWNGSVRGRTLSNSYVIIDECQNFSKKSLQTVMTRMDESCKVVLIGSNRQIDHPYINKHTNGLNTLLEAANVENDDVTVFATELNKVERGKITEWSEKIFEN